MTRATRTALPPLRAHCGMTVCIPARNEAVTIGDALAALAQQRDLDGRPIARGRFDILVLANNCRDGTAAAVRAFAATAPTVDITVRDAIFAPRQAHIGTARKAVMDLAAARFLAAGRPRGIIASIDADTLAAPTWIASIEAEMRGRDAVAGYVTIAAADHERLLAPLRLLYTRELAYRRVLAEVEALIDPDAGDPAPRHGSFVGASFAVTASAYTEAGGIPPLSRLEDQAFSRALRRNDARIRHSLAVRATTSARRTPRVGGGFGTFIAALDAHAARGESYLVEHPQRSVEDLELRATIGRIRAGDARPAEIERCAAILRLAPGGWLDAIDPALPRGSCIERVLERAHATRSPAAGVPVEVAIEVLRGIAADIRSAAHADDTAEVHESLHAG